MHHKKGWMNRRKEGLFRLRFKIGLKRGKVRWIPESLVGKVFRTRDAEKVYCSLPCKQEAKERKLIIKTKGPNKETEEMTESIKSSIEAKIKASEEALAKSEKEQLQLKARVETLYEIYNNLRENAA